MMNQMECICTLHITENCKVQSIIVHWKMVQLIHICSPRGVNTGQNPTTKSIFHLDDSDYVAHLLQGSQKLSTDGVLYAGMDHNLSCLCSKITFVYGQKTIGEVFEDFKKA